MPQHGVPSAERIVQVERQAAAQEDDPLLLGDVPGGLDLDNAGHVGAEAVAEPLADDEQAPPRADPPRRVGDGASRTGSCLP